jgi:hypothetical protein
MPPSILSDRTIEPRPRGRPFRTGNPGRKRGSLNRATVAANALVRGEEEAITRKAIELALQGNVVLLKYFLDRILARDRTISFQLPDLNYADDAVEVLRCVLRLITNGEISPSEGAAVAAVVDSYSNAIDTADVANRNDLLEAEIRTAKARSGGARAA